MALAEARVFCAVGKHGGKNLFHGNLARVRKAAGAAGKIGQMERFCGIFSFFKRHGATRSANGCCALGMRQVRDVRLRKIKIFDEQIFEFGQKVQRPAQKGYLAGNGSAAGQPADGLLHHRLKNGGRDIFTRDAAVEQWHNIRFGEHAAA